MSLAPRRTPEFSNIRPDLSKGVELLGNLAERTTATAENAMKFIEKMITGLPPKKTAPLAALIIGLLTYFSPNQESDKKKEETQNIAGKKEGNLPPSAIANRPQPQAEKKLKNPRQRIAPKKQPEYQEVMVRSGNRVLKYAIDPSVAKELIDNFRRDEALRNVENGGIALRRSVDESFKYARRIAREMGYDIVPFSGHRSAEHQQRLYANAPQEKRGTFIAPPGSSWHQSGGAVDCGLVRIGNRDILTPTSSSADRPSEYTDILEKCMNRAGFVRLNNESWHFEIGTSGWADIMKKQGFIRSDAKLAEYIYKRDQLPS